MFGADPGWLGPVRIQFRDADIVGVTSEFTRCLNMARHLAQHLAQHLTYFDIHWLNTTETQHNSTLRKRPWHWKCKQRPQRCKVYAIAAMTHGSCTEVSWWKQSLFTTNGTRQISLCPTWGDGWMSSHSICIAFAQNMLCPFHNGPKSMLGMLRSEVTNALNNYVLLEHEVHWRYHHHRQSVSWHCGKAGEEWQRLPKAGQRKANGMSWAGRAKHKQVVWSALLLHASAHFCRESASIHFYSSSWQLWETRCDFFSRFFGRPKSCSAVSHFTILWKDATMILYVYEAAIPKSGVPVAL